MFRAMEIFIPVNVVLLDLSSVAVATVNGPLSWILNGSGQNQTRDGSMRGLARSRLAVAANSMPMCAAYGSSPLNLPFARLPHLAQKEGQIANGDPDLSGWKCNFLEGAAKAEGERVAQEIACNWVTDPLRSGEQWRRRRLFSRLLVDPYQPGAVPKEVERTSSLK